MRHSKNDRRNVTATLIPPEPDIPEKIGRFPIIRLLGSGAMGAVYLGRHPNLETSVAIKVIQAGRKITPEDVERFQNEARIATRIRSPYVAHVHDLESDRGAPFLVMEFVEGTTLRRVLSKPSLSKKFLGSLPAKIGFCRQIAMGIESAHHAGTVHRDLKPENLMVTDEGQAKILDFGIAKSGDIRDLSPGSGNPGSRDGTRVGSPGYTSPEQCRGRASDFRTDFWSFGCILYECLAGKQAFPGVTFPQEPNPALIDWKRLPHETPNEVRDLIGRCLRTDREERPNSAGELVRVLTGLVSEPNSAPPVLSADSRQETGSESARERIPTATTSPNRSVRLLVAGLIIIGLVWIVWQTVQAPGPRPPIQMIEVATQIVSSAADEPNNQWAQCRDTGPLRIAFLKSVNTVQEWVFQRGGFRIEREDRLPPSYTVGYGGGALICTIEDSDENGRVEHVISSANGDSLALVELGGTSPRLFERVYAPDSSGDGLRDSRIRPTGVIRNGPLGEILIAASISERDTVNFRGVIAFSRESGAILWRYPTGPNPSPDSFRFVELDQEHDGPEILFNMVPCGNGVDRGGTTDSLGWIVAITSTGEMLWQHGLADFGFNPIWSDVFWPPERAPVVLACGSNGTRGAVTNDRGEIVDSLRVLDGRSGELLSTFEWSDRITGFCALDSTRFVLGTQLAQIAILGIDSAGKVHEERRRRLRTKPTILLAGEFGGRDGPEIVTVYSGQKTEIGIFDQTLTQIAAVDELNLQALQKIEVMERTEDDALLLVGVEGSLHVLEIPAEERPAGGFWDTVQGWFN